MRILDNLLEEKTVAGTQIVFSAEKLEKLTSASYTLVDIEIDNTGSVNKFAHLLKECLKKVITSCQKTSRSDSILVRVTTFSSTNGIQELHGFKKLNEIDIEAYPDFSPNGGTPLYDAIYESVSTANAYAKELSEQEYLVNSIHFIITDGEDNISITTPVMIQRQIAEIKQKEEVESIITILIGINDAAHQQELDYVKNTCELDYYIKGVDSTPESLAKLGKFISQSISSQSEALGSGGPSQTIGATI